MGAKVQLNLDYYNGYFIECLRTTRQVEIVPSVIHDTLIMTHELHDSIYTKDTATCQYRIGTIDTTVIPTIGHPLRVDTIYKDRLRYTYRYKLLRDTLYINKVDSVPVVQTVQVEKQVQYVPPWCKFLATAGAIALLLPLLFTLRKFHVI